MGFDPFHAVRTLERFLPHAARKLAMTALGLMSPFNAHLKTELLEWTDAAAIVRLRHRRGVRNHVAAIHAGAQFTLGETCAGLVIIRNFPFSAFRPLMCEVDVKYLKQARSDITGICRLTPEEISAAKEKIANGEIPVLEMTTDITGLVNGVEDVVSVVKTVWQIKPWKLVRTS